MTSATKALAVAEVQLRVTRIELYRHQAWKRAMTRTRKTRHHSETQTTSYS